MRRERFRRMWMFALAAAILLLLNLFLRLPQRPGPDGRAPEESDEVATRPLPPVDAPGPGDVNTRPPGPALPDHHKPPSDGLVDVTVRVRVAEGSPRLRYATVYVLPSDAAGGGEGAIHERNGSVDGNGNAKIRVPPGPSFLGVISTQHLPLLRAVDVPAEGMHLEVTVDGGATLEGTLVDAATGERADIDTVIISAGDPAAALPHRFPGAASPPGFSREITLHGDEPGDLVVHGLPPGPVRITPDEGLAMIEWRAEGATVSVPAAGARIPMRRNPLVEFQIDPPPKGRIPLAKVDLINEDTGRRISFTWNDGTDALTSRVPEGRWVAELRVTGSGFGRVNFEAGTADDRKVVPVTLAPMHRVRFTRADGVPLGGYMAIDTGTASDAVRGNLGRTFGRRWTPSEEQFVELMAGPHVFRWADGESWAAEEFDPAGAESAGGVVLSPVPATVVVARTGKGSVEARDAEGRVVPGIELRPNHGFAGTSSHLYPGESCCFPPIEGLTLRVNEDGPRIPLTPGARVEIDLESK